MYSCSGVFGWQQEEGASTEYHRGIRCYEECAGLALVVTMERWVPVDEDGR